MFDKDQFIADRQGAIAGPHASRDIRDIMSRVVSEPSDVLKTLGDPPTAGVAIPHRAPDLTIINLAWAPKW